MIFLLFIFSILSLIYIISVTKKQNETLQPSSTKESYKSFEAGKSDYTEVQTVLGKPLKEEKEGEFRVYYYPSQSAARNDKLYFKEEKLHLAKEIVAARQNLKSNEITVTYGVAPYVLYGSDSTSGFYLYIYPDKGIAYIGNPYSEDLLEIWHFQKTTIEDFRKDFAPKYEEMIPIKQ